jgi:calpain-15
LALFYEKIEPADIKQGSLGDCYFLSSLAALAEHPNRIRKLFVNQERNSAGTYGVVLCKNGKQQLILVDNYIPCKNGKPCFSRANEKEMWVMILEKAWAKIHGSYRRIESGSTVQTLRDLTGAPGNQYVISETENMWDIIVEANEKDYILCCSIKP